MPFNHCEAGGSVFSLFLFGMEVTTELVQKLAELARLQFTAEETALVKNDLQRMIAFVEKLQEVDTRDTSPLLQMGKAMNVLREDETGNQLPREAAMANAPDAADGYFRVPKVIKK